ncbi:MAG: GntR family transcriptional regulator [Candidatus Cryptobacteroides sp.]
MGYKFVLDERLSTPVYRQLMNQVEQAIQSGEIKSGECLPSMNELAATLEISKETVKKAYTYLRNKGLICATQGKGFFIADKETGRKPRILILFDKLSNSKQVLFNSFSATIGDRAEMTIQLHNQNLDLLQYYIDENLNLYDYFVITPHFPLDIASRRNAVRQLRRIPNRKLILLDHNPEGLPGKYGAVYQDFENDAYNGLKQGLRKLKASGKLNVITEMSSLYHEEVTGAVKRFCHDFEIDLNFEENITPEIIREKETYLLVCGQIDLGLAALAKAAEEKKMKPGRDFNIISYNESPINDIILNGLTTISTDFAEMGRLGAEMIINQDFRKVKCPFGMTRRKTF